MFDNSTLEAYRAVKAPDRLKEKVLESVSSGVGKKAEGNVVSFSKIRSFGLAAAACLILAFGSWGLLGGGVTLSESAAGYGISLAREIGVQEFEFEISQRGFCKVTASEGELVCGGKSGEELLLCGNKNVKLVLPAEFDGEAEITVVRYGKATAYRIVKNADSGEFEIYPAE